MELNAAQGQAVDIGGYFFADPVKINLVMRPKDIFNSSLASFAK